MFDLVESSKAAAKAFKNAGWRWYNGAPRWEQIAEKINEQLHTVDAYRKEKGSHFRWVEVSSGRIATAMVEDEEDGTVQVSVYLELGDIFLAPGEELFD